MRQQKDVKGNLNYRKQWEAGFRLASSLLGAQDENMAIQAAMRTGNDWLGAEGCVFVPFNEWEQTYPVLKFGQTDFLEDGEWQTLLSAPATRHTCRNCATKQAGAECVLLSEQVDFQNVYCISLRCGGREIGVVSYFFSAPLQVGEEQRLFLAELVHLTDLALGSLRAHARELEAYRRAAIPFDLKTKLGSSDALTRELLGQLEYKAVLDERTRLAREIHDGLAQTLAFLKLEAGRMQTYVSKGEVDAVTRALQGCYRTLSDAYLDARQAIDNLRYVPDELLSDWLQTTAANFKTLTGMTVDISNVQLSYAFTPSIKAQLIRIVQEALTNIRKHARACKVKVSAFERAGEAIIEIQDNGCGFSPEDSRPAARYGLRSMRERAESIGAELQITSAPGLGTTVRLRIPVMEKAKP